MITDQDIAFPTLTAAQIGALRPRGTLRHVGQGETLWEEGDRGMAFFVVLEGEMEIVDPSGDEVRRITVHRAGEFSGDVDMLSGRTSLVRAHMLRPGQVLELDSEALRRVIRANPGNQRGAASCLPDAQAAAAERWVSGDADHRLSLFSPGARHPRVLQPQQHPVHLG